MKERLFIRSWIDINLDNLENNFKIIQLKKQKKTKIISIVKSNGYGHGMVEIANKLEKIGTDMFAVATISEGIVLRNHGIKRDILIFGMTPLEEVEYIVKYNLIQTITSYEYLLDLDNISLSQKSVIRCHIKIDTGMGRVGFFYNDIKKIKESYEKNNLKIEGIYSHLSSSESLEIEDVLYTKKQIDRFDKVLESLKKLDINCYGSHLQNTGGLINYSYLSYDFVRAGIFVYGYDPTEIFNDKLKPVMNFFSKISMIKVLEKDSFISYNRRFKTDKQMKIATVSVGYGDGYNRVFSNKSFVKVGGRLSRVLGNITMDQIMIDITDLENIQIGETVLLFGEDQDGNRLDLGDYTKKVGVIPYEIFTGITNRVERRYIEKMQLFNN